LPAGLLAIEGSPDLSWTITSADVVERALRSIRFAKKRRTRNCSARCSRNLLSGNSCQAALHGCLPAETAPTLSEHCGSNICRLPRMHHRKQTRCVAPLRIREARAAATFCFPTIWNWSVFPGPRAQPCGWF